MVEVTLEISKSAKSEDSPLTPFLGSWRKHGAVRVIKVKLLRKQGVNVGNERVSTEPWETL